MKVYKSRLNGLMRENESWSDVPALKKNSKKIIKYISDIADDSERGRTKKRGILQAIFAVLDTKYRKTKNNYYKYWQTVMPLKTSDGEEWKSKKNL